MEIEELTNLIDNLPEKQKDGDKNIKVPEELTTSYQNFKAMDEMIENIKILGEYVKNTVDIVEKWSQAIQAAQTTSDIELSYVGEFRITSYCSCEKCCGKWALNRPKVGNKEVISTASGSFAEAGITAAVDPEVIPYGTKVYIEGFGVRVAQDKGGSVKGNHIDIFFRTHEECKVNLYNVKVWVIEE